ncbi:hypothetical protein PI125_g18965 [Phytophthora idaei]|nr:hypothetical protein PI125_g18965 [Phytophthora idaei]
MFQATKSSHQLMNKVWLEALEAPTDVFTTLRLADNTLDEFYCPELIGWIRYSRDYKQEVRFSTKKTLNILMKAPHEEEADFGLLFLSLAKDKAIKKDTTMKDLIERLQSQLYKSWIDAKMTSDKLRTLIASPVTENWKRVFSLPTTDPKFMLLKAYTLQYSANRGDGVLKSVQTLFAKNKPVDALTRAMRA